MATSIADGGINSLAYAEMRLIISRLVWNFDFTLAPGMEDWYERCGAYTIWEKPALGISFVPRSPKGDLDVAK